MIITQKQTSSKEEHTVSNSTESTTTESAESTTLTGYQMAKAVNKLLVSKGYNKIPAQMVYSYIKQGYIPSVVVNGQNRVELSVAREWAAKYIARKETAKEATEVSL